MHGPARPKRPPHGKEGLKKAAGRPRPRSTARRIREVSLERAKEKSAVGRPDPVLDIHAKLVYAHNLRHALAIRS